MGATAFWPSHMISNAHDRLISDWQESGAHQTGQSCQRCGILRETPTLPQILQQQQQDEMTPQ